MPLTAESPINRLEVLPNDVAFYSNRWNHEITVLYTFIYFHYSSVRAIECEIHLTQLGSFSCFLSHQTVNWVDVCMQVWNTYGVFPFILSTRLWGWMISSSLMHHLQWWKVFWCVLDLIFFLNMDINTVSTLFIFRPSELFYFCISLIFLCIKIWDL